MAGNKINPDNLRLFMAISLHQFFSGNIRGIIDGLKKKTSGIKWVKPDQAHTTLHFFGSVPKDEIQKINDINERIQINKSNGAKIIDMETVVYASICDSMNISFYSIRSVSDTFKNNETLDYDVNLDKACLQAQIEVVNFINEIVKE